MSNFSRAIAALSLFFLLPSCGGGDGPPVEQLQGMPPAREGIPDRTSTHVYAQPFAVDDSRTFSGIGYELVTVRADSVRPNGRPTLVTEATFSNTTNSRFEYDASERSATFHYGDQISTAVDNGQNLTRAPNNLLWYDPSADIPYSILYSRGAEQNSPYIAYARNTTFNADGSETVQGFAGGSRTLSDDFPPRGFAVRSFGVLIEVLQTEATEGLSGSGTFLLDFDFSEDQFVTLERKIIGFAQGSGIANLDLTVSGSIKRDEASLLATVTDAASGATATLRGFCYGPYGEDIHMSGLIVLGDGRQAIITIFS